MATITGTQEVVSMLWLRTLKGKKKASVFVGFSASYSLFVHENLQAHHPIGQAKYLEQPFRQLAYQMVQTVRQTLLARRSLEDGLFKAGHMLLDAAKALVPVDSGHLRDSGYVEVK